jgi:sarcosine oxidase
MRHADVVVVGAGVMGSATAWRLALAGRSVLLLEQFEVGHDRGSSHGNVRVFRFSYDEVEYVRMAQAALPLWRELEEASDRPLLEVTGGFDLGPRERLEAHRSAMRSGGVPSTVLSGAEAMARHPALSLPPDARVLHQPGAGVLSAADAVRAFVDGARAHGAVVGERTRVIELRPGARHVDVVSQDDVVRASVAVVTAGAWARPLLAGAGIDLPVTPSREAVAFFRVRRGGTLPVVVEWVEGPLYALPAGSDGLKTGWHYSGPAADPDVPGGPGPGVLERMSAWVAERFPGVEPEAHRFETCLYTNTHDERFILERHGRVVVGSPCSGHGFKFAPLIGERLARLAVSA